MEQINIDIDRLRQEGIFVMVPAYAGQCSMSFANSMMKLSHLCGYYGIPLECFTMTNESLITRARNYCVDSFLRYTFEYVKPDGEIEQRPFQHGMFIDSDIEFDAMDVLLMAHLQSFNPDYTVLCGPYPKKNISYEKIAEAVKKGFADENPNNLSNFVGDFVFSTVKEEPFNVAEIIEVKDAGTGFMMFHRDVFSEIDKHFTDIKYKPDSMRSNDFDGRRMISAYFDTSIDPDSKRYLSEDYHFCRLARKSGMKVWLIPWLKLKHHGHFVYSGSIEAMAQAEITATFDVTKIIK